LVCLAHALPRLHRLWRTPTQVTNGRRCERDPFEAMDTQRRVGAAGEHPSAGGDVYWLHAEKLSVISYQLSVISYQVSVHGRMIEVQHPR
jgi:hypothetical protein